MSKLLHATREDKAHGNGVDEQWPERAEVVPHARFCAGATRNGGPLWTTSSPFRRGGGSTDARVPTTRTRADSHHPREQRNNRRY